MSRDDAWGLGFITGSLLFIGILVGVCLWSASVWNGTVAVYNKKWPTHQGIILSAGHQVITPYGSRAGFTVEFPDYYERSRVASVYGYPRPVGANVPVRVNPNGAAVVSGAIYNYMRPGSQRHNPTVKHYNFFPIGADLLIGGVANFFFSWLIGYLIFEFAEGRKLQLRHRLGTT